MKSTRTLRAAFWLAVAGMAFFAMAASSPQCARTSESVSGPILGPQAGGDPCIQGCNNQAQQLKNSEKARFKAAIAACNGDAQCRANEEAAHTAIMAEINADKQACQADCAHQQGTGLGGQ